MFATNPHQSALCATLAHQGGAVNSSSETKSNGIKHLAVIQKWAPALENAPRIKHLRAAMEVRHELVASVIAAESPLAPSAAQAGAGGESAAGDEI
jgi:hypothetical protein